MFLRNVFRIPKFFLVFLLAIILLTGSTSFVSSFSIPNKDKGVNKFKEADREIYHNGIGISFSTHAAECGICHQKEFNEWRYAVGSDLDSIGEGTYHSISSIEEMYQAMLSVVDPELHFYCKSCHESGNAWAVKDKINDIPEPRTQNIEEGINCIVCHYDGSKLVGKKELKDPMFCATCHNAGDSITDTYLEWLNDYKSDKTCQQCHMKKDGHIFPGLHSASLVSDAINIGDPVIPDNIKAGVPFDILVNLTNYGAGHSVPVSILRRLRLRVSILKNSNVEITSYEKDFYKRFPLFGEDSAETEIIRAGETKQIAFQGEVDYPGIYTIKVELLQDLNRLEIMNSTIFMGTSYKTFTAQQKR